MNIISYGGGVQSTAMVVLAAQRDPEFLDAVGGPIDAALFSNVGDDSEHPASLAYVRDVAIPWAAERELDVIELHRTKRNGETETLVEAIAKPETRGVPIPMRTVDGAPGRRSCTADFKIRVVSRWIREHGATADNPATVCIGISTDEIQRVNNRRHDNKREQVIYPLIDLGMSRQDCMNVIADAGLPVPRKSSCFFCPFHTLGTWAEMRRDEPVLFRRSVEIEEIANETRARIGKDPLYMTRLGRPLDQAVQAAQDQLPGLESISEGGCDEGYCFT